MKKRILTGAFLALFILFAASGASAAGAQLKNSAKRWVSWALTLAMLIGLLLGMSMTTLAYDGNPFTALVNTTTTVKFNDMD